MNPNNANGTYRVTVRDVYEAVHRLEAQVAELTAIAKALPDHESRLRRLEAWKNAIPPAIVIAAASLIAALVGAR